ncbi:MAG: hypothetical protein J0M12_00360 [Deltaproteobacteria bacterium]|nr:hypothetical protein [Deltaproteobacteria bacterium]
MKLLLNLFLVAVLVPSAVWAEHLCRASVSYAWQREKEMTKIMVFTTRVEAKGADEAAAKAALMELVEPLKSKAAEQCSHDHENQAGCVAAKINVMSAALHSMTFSSRKLLEDSIASDCKAQQGKCVESVVSEPTCSLIVVAAKPDAKDAAKEEKEKGAKKKK